MAQATADGSAARRARREEERARAAHLKWYGEVIERLHAMVRSATPEGARFVVVSKGDDALLAVPGRTGLHFPQTPSGRYAGFHPADGAAALDHLHEVRARGADFFVVPVTALWWLDHYDELRAYLEDSCTLVADEPETGRVFSLLGTAPSVAASPAGGRAQAAARSISAWVDAVVPPGRPVLAVGSAAPLLSAGHRPLTAAAEPTEAALAELLGTGPAGRHVVLCLDGDRRQRLSAEALRAALAERARPVARQSLAEIFEVREDGAAAGTGAPAPSIPARAHAAAARPRTAATQARLRRFRRTFRNWRSDVRA